MRTSGRRGDNSKVLYREEIIANVPYFILPLKHAVEFMSRKDYTENWKSELNEEFTFFSFNDWKRFLTIRGFSIIENPNEPSESSRVYTNEWIIKNRYKGKTDLFIKTGKKLIPLEYPSTNIVLIAEKPNY